LRCWGYCSLPRAESDGDLDFDTWLICGLIQPGGLHPHGVGLMWSFLVLKINGINKRVEWFRFALSTKKVVNLVAASVVLS
jgi:hypothetical protein